MENLDIERNTRWIREAIWIRRKGGNNKSTLMNADKGAYQLSHIYVQLIQRASSKKDDVTVSRPGSAASTVWENILTGCQNVTTTKINSKLDFSKELYYYWCWIFWKACDSEILMNSWVYFIGIFYRMYLFLHPWLPPSMRQRWQHTFQWMWDGTRRLRTRLWNHRGSSRRM